MSAEQLEQEQEQRDDEYAPMVHPRPVQRVLNARRAVRRLAVLDLAESLRAAQRAEQLAANARADLATARLRYLNAQRRYVDQLVAAGDTRFLR